jgi:hypothetical protein
VKIRATTQQIRARVTTTAFNLATRATNFALTTRANAYKIKIEVGHFLSLKFFTETISILSLPALFFNKAGITDSATIDDTTVLDPSKGITDATTVSEVFAKVQAKGFSDRFSIEDGGLYFLEDYTSIDYTAGVQPIFSMGKNISDSAGFSDVLGNFSITKGIVDTPMFTDGIALNKSKLIETDTANVSEAYAALFSNSATDGITVAENFITLYSKGVADSAAWSDISSLVIGPVVQDALNTSDSGSLRSQGYCSFDYFAADYVGTSLTF